jgi:hypothetical protein
MSLYERVQAARERACDYSPYVGRDGITITCTREQGHSGACYWPSRPSNLQRAISAHTLPVKDYSR